MKYFALNGDGQIHALGRHGDEDAALEYFINTYKHELCIWLFDENAAENMALTILEGIAA